MRVEKIKAGDLKTVKIWALAKIVKSPPGPNQAIVLALGKIFYRPALRALTPIFSKNGPFLEIYFLTFWVYVVFTFFENASM